MDFMELARQQALLGRGRTSPNPIVGAVIVKENDVVGTGFHAGGAHAEVEALAAAGEKSVGATLYCTLEPCKHVGRTGPCTEAIINSGIREVIYAVADPTSLAGGGAQILAAAGITVLHQPNISIEFDNRAWLHKAKTGTPYVIAKSAMTLDGMIAAADGTSKWITCEESRHDVAELRAGVDAIITGTGTVLADDPLLTVRGVERDLQPTRIVVGTQSIPSSLRINSDHGYLQVDSPESAIAYCSDKGFNSVLVESGPQLLTSFISAELIDEWWIYVAPRILGSGKALVADLGLTTLTQAKNFEVAGTTLIGSDVRMIVKKGADVHGNR